MTAGISDQVIPAAC